MVPQSVTSDPSFSSDNVDETSKKLADRFLEKAYGSSLLLNDGGAKDCLV